MILTTVIISLKSINALQPVTETMCRHADAMLLFRTFSDFKWSIPRGKQIIQTFWCHLQIIGIKQVLFWEPTSIGRHQETLAPETCELLIQYVYVVSMQTASYQSAFQTHWENILNERFAHHYTNNTATIRHTLAKNKFNLLMVDKLLRHWSTSI
jgi:hypothetical protein